MKTKVINGESLALPGLFAAADRAAAANQRTFFAAKAAELLALTLGAIFGLLSNGDLGGAGPMLAIIMFLVALAIQLSRVGQRAERRWYDARAAAESIKSASWQYAVGGEAFRLDVVDADRDFLARLGEILKALPRLNLGGATVGAAGATEDMQQLRESPQEHRYLRYRQERIDNQIGWYADKAASNKKRSLIWGAGVVAVELGAVALGILRVRGTVDVDLLGVLATAAAGMVAWIQSKNYTELSESYALTSHEVSLVAETVRAGVGEPAWAQSVHDAEAAFSREHTMWLARKQATKH